MFCSGPTSRSLQGAFERMSEETNVGGLLSSRSGEVLIYSISVGLGFGRTEAGWVGGFSARSSGGGGRPEERQRKENRRKIWAQSKEQHNVQQLLWNSQIVFISTHALCCWSGLLWFVHIVNAMNTFSFQKMAVWIASHSKMSVLGDGLREIEQIGKKRGDRRVKENRHFNNRNHLEQKIKAFFYCDPFSR